MSSDSDKERTTSQKKKTKPLKSTDILSAELQVLMGSMKTVLDRRLQISTTQNIPEIQDQIFGRMIASFDDDL